MQLENNQIDKTFLVSNELPFDLKIIRFLRSVHSHKPVIVRFLFLSFKLTLLKKQKKALDVSPSTSKAAINSS